MNPLMLMPLLQPLIQLVIPNQGGKAGPANPIIAILTGNIFSFIEAIAGLARGGHCPPQASTEYCCERDRHGGYRRDAESKELAEKKETLEAMRTIRQHYQRVDVAGAFIKSPDGLIGRNDLDAIIRDPSSSSALRDAAQHLLNTPGVFDEIARRGPFITRSGLDDAIERGKEATTPVRGADAASALAQGASGAREARASHAEGSKPKAPASNAGTSTSIRDIVNNPSLSVEEKLRMILLEVMRTLDDDMLKVGEEMSAVAEERESLPSDDRSQDSKLGRDMDRLSDRLQNLAQKRKAMFELLSHMTSNFGEMSMLAISNLGKA
ncbi:MAG: hypothetical protein ACKVPX_05830 [Myxococcaceae bacterium]